MKIAAARKGLAGLAVLAACLLTTAAPAQSPEDPVAAMAAAPTNPLYHATKVKNYLPDMRWPEVEALMKKTDIVLIPVAALEQHGPQGPIGTDFLNAVETSKLIAQRTDVLVAPILMAGNSPYHMEFPGSVTLPEELIQEVYFQAAKGFIRQGWKRFILYGAHGGNAAIVQFVADRINQQTPGIAVVLSDGMEPFMKHRGGPRKAFDEHAGVGETSRTMYLNPGLVDLSVARKAKLTYPPHLEAMAKEVLKGNPTADLVFHAEALKDKLTGKHVSTREMSDTGSWSELDTSTATAAQGKAATESMVEAAVKFIDEWKRLRPSGTP